VGRILDPAPVEDVGDGEADMEEVVEILVLLVLGGMVVLAADYLLRKSTP
jgi:hypothetical protein